MWCPDIREVAQSKCEGMVVSPELERAALLLEPEVPDSTEGGQELSVESAVGDLSAVHLLGKETKRLPWAPWVVLLVQGGPHVGSSGIGHQSQLGLQGRMGQFCRGGEAVLGQVEGSQYVGQPLDPCPAGEPFRASLRGASTWPGTFCRS